MNLSMLATPPTRGWTRLKRDSGCYPKGYPAYAGMDPIRDVPAPRALGLPRLRGDGPKQEIIQVAKQGATPPTRGWTLSFCGRRLLWIGYPAYAGMDLVEKAINGTDLRLPRLRGDGPGLVVNVWRGLAATPPTRGWTPLSARQPVWGTGYPAYAGMDPRRTGQPPRPVGLPRLRGDGPVALNYGLTHYAATPPTRGWTLSFPRFGEWSAGYPAYAGMDPELPSVASASERLPRLRGDGPLVKGRERYPMNELDVQIIEKDGEPEYAIVPIEKYRRMIAALEDATDSAAIKRAWAEDAAGETN